jgi:endonuclease YncB( thermonuclease family)
MIKFFLQLLLCWVVLADKPLYVVDGDTFDVQLQVWHNLSIKERVRVLGIDTPELKGASRDKALEAKAFTQKWLAQGPFSLETCQRDVFGRILAKVSRGSSVLAEELRSAGHVK